VSVYILVCVNIYNTYMGKIEFKLKKLKMLNLKKCSRINKWNFHKKFLVVISIKQLIAQQSTHKHTPPASWPQTAISSL